MVKFKLIPKTHVVYAHSLAAEILLKREAHLVRLFPYRRMYSCVDM